MHKLLLVLLVIVLFGIAFAEQSYPAFEGTWVLYEGASVAPEVLVFRSDGLGMCYELRDSYISDSWVWAGEIKEEYLTNPQVLNWTVEPIKRDPFNNSFFTLTIQIDEKTRHYSVELMPDMTCTGLEGMVLTMESGAGGGWLKVDYCP